MPLIFQAHKVLDAKCHLKSSFNAKRYIYKDGFYCSGSENLFKTIRNVNSDIYLNSNGGLYKDPLQ